MNSEVIHLCSWATTRRGTPLELYQKTHSSQASGQAPWLFIGGVHGDEPEGVRLGEELRDWLLEEERKSPLRDNWILIPCLNPDGYQKRLRGNADGVDLNRNFPTHDWSPEAKAPRYFPGPQPASEPEVQALIRLIETVKPQVIFHFHSWIPSIVYTGEEARSWSDFFANEKYPAQSDIGYPTPGSLGQYGWYQHKIPVVCIEEKAGMNLNKVWGNFQNGFERMFKR